MSRHQRGGVIFWILLGKALIMEFSHASSLPVSRTTDGLSLLAESHPCPPKPRTLLESHTLGLHRCSSPNLAVICDCRQLLCKALLC